MPELDLTWLLPDGAVGGMGPDGPVKLRGALPGDRVIYELETQRGRTIIGRLEAVVDEGPDRRASPCEWSDRCGGCDLDQLGIDAQRAAKAAMVQRALRLPEPPPILHRGPRRAYRARIKLALVDGRVGYRQARSHDLVPVEACGIARPEVETALGRLRPWAAEHGTEGLDSVEIRSDGTRAVFHFVSDGSVPRSQREALPALGDVALDGRAVAGDPTLWLTLAGTRLRASPRAFFQVNLDVNADLVSLVAGAVAEVQPERVLDLYAGIGNLTLPIAQASGAPVLAVEREGQAMDDLAANAAAAGLDDRIRALPMPVERFDPSREPFDVVVLDPPRVGAPGIVDELLRNRPRRIVYVACHPPAAGRDLKAAREAGYGIARVSALDMFPDTHHVETVVVLDRGTGTRSHRAGKGRRRR